MHIGTEVGVRLVHIVDITAEHGFTKYRYVVHTAWVDRPAHGVCGGWAECSVCDEWIPFRLSSRARARRLRNWECAIALAGAVAAAVLFATLLMLDTGDGVSLGAAVACLVGIGVGGCTAALVGYLAAAEDGVAMSLKERRRAPHEVKPISPRQAMRKPEPGRSAPMNIAFDS